MGAGPSNELSAILKNRSKLLSAPPETQQTIADYVWRRYVAPRLKRVQGLGLDEQLAAKQTWTRSFLKQTPQQLPESFGRPEVPEPNRALGFLGTMAHGAESGAASMAGFVGELTGSEVLKKAPEAYRTATPELTELAERYTKEHPPALLGLAGAESLGKMVPSMIAGEAALAPLAGVAAPATRLGRVGLSALRGAVAGTAGAPAFTSDPSQIATYGTGLGAVLGGLGGAISRRAAPSAAKGVGAEVGAASAMTSSAVTLGSEDAAIRAEILKRFPNADATKPTSEMLRNLPRGAATEVLESYRASKITASVGAGAAKRLAKFTEQFGAPTVEQQSAIEAGGEKYRAAIKAAKAAEEESARLAKAKAREAEIGFAKEQSKLRKLLKRPLTPREIERVRKGESATDIAGAAAPTAVAQGAVAAAPKVAPATISSKIGAGTQPPTGTAQTAATVGKLSTGPAPTTLSTKGILSRVAKSEAELKPNETSMEAVQVRTTIRRLFPEIDWKAGTTIDQIISSLTKDQKAAVEKAITDEMALYESGQHPDQARYSFIRIDPRTGEVRGPIKHEGEVGELMGHMGPGGVVGPTPVGSSSTLGPEVAKQVSAEQPQAPAAVQAIQEVLGTISEATKQGLSTEVPADDLAKAIQLRASEREIVEAETNSDVAKQLLDRAREDARKRLETLGVTKYAEGASQDVQVKRVLAQLKRVEDAIAKGDFRGATLTKLGRPKAGTKAPRLLKTGAAAKAAIERRGESLPLPKAIPKVEDL